MVTGSGTSEEATFLTPPIDCYVLFIAQNRRGGDGLRGAEHWAITA